MTTLPSQIGSATVAATRTNITQLRNNATYPGFKKTFLNHCHLNHGQVGQDLITGITTKVEPLGNRPHYSDELIHPVTNEKIHGSRKYERERPPPEEKSEDGIKSLALAFDLDTLPLTEKGQARFDKDIASYERRESANLAAHNILKKDDDDAIRVLHDHISQEALNQITISPLHATWLKHPYSCTTRSILFCQMLDSLFSKGNSTESVDQAAILFNLKQSPDQQHPSAFLNTVNDQIKIVIALLQDKDHPGYISVNRIHSMVTINGLDKASSANREGIKTHLTAHPEDALDLPTELIASILRAHMSDLNTDRVSEQSSAFVAQLHPEPATKSAASKWTYHEDRKDKSAIPGLTHCANCFKIMKGMYYYSHSTERCKRTAAGDWKDHKEKKAGVTPKLQAKVAEATADPAYPTLGACLALLHYDIQDSNSPGLTRHSALAYLVEHHPEELG